jgi:hypothetical protein
MTRMTETVMPKRGGGAATRDWAAAGRRRGYSSPELLYLAISFLSADPS